MAVSAFPELIGVSSQINMSVSFSARVWTDNPENLETVWSVRLIGSPKQAYCVAPFGMLALFGAASGPAPEIQPEILNKKGCLFLTRPSVFPHNATPELLQENARAVFDAIAQGRVKVKIGAKFSLEQAAEAHKAAEGRKVSGAIVITP